MESGGFCERNSADVLMFKIRILVFNRKVDLLRNPFHNVVRHFEPETALFVDQTEGAQLPNNLHCSLSIAAVLHNTGPISKMSVPISHLQKPVEKYALRNGRQLCEGCTL